MPLYGLVHDSPLLYAAQKGLRGARGSSRISSFSSSRHVSTSTTITYAFSGVKIYDSALLAELNTNKGSLWKHLERRSDLALRAAKRQVGVKTGRLQRATRKYHLGNYTGQYVWIGSKVPYAYAHHEGTKPHTIKAEQGGVLVFGGTKAFRGRVIRTPEVNHPGNKPNPYLRNQLRYFHM